MPENINTQWVTFESVAQEHDKEQMEARQEQMEAEREDVIIAIRSLIHNL